MNPTATIPVVTAVNNSEEVIPVIETLKHLCKNEEGLSSVEYALLLVLIVIVSITAWQTLGGHISEEVNALGSK
jgi:Flp pilus assembly pilin Flp